MRSKVDYQAKQRECSAPAHAGERMMPFAAFHVRRDGRPQSWCKECARLAARRRSRLIAGLAPGTRAELLQSRADRWAARDALLDRLSRGCDCCGQSNAHYLVWPRRHPGRWIERNGVLCGNCYIARRQWGGCYAALRRFGQDRGEPLGPGGGIAAEVVPPDAAATDPAHRDAGAEVRHGHPGQEPLPLAAMAPEPGDVIVNPPTFGEDVVPADAGPDREPLTLERLEELQAPDAAAPPPEDGPAL